MINQSILRVEHVYKRIGKQDLLFDVSFEVKEGEIFGLLGPNGSGKTTLIRAILGLVKKTSGRIFIGHYDVAKSFEQAMMQVGAIVENPEFYEYLTGYQNLVHFANMVEGVTPERIDEVIRLVNLEESIHNRVGTYSLGMRQRLGIAQAILHKPKLLILDEPTNGLDPSGMKELRVYLRKLCKEENVSIVIASHLLKEIEELCDRVAIIQYGEVVAVRAITKQDEALRHVLFEVDDAAKAILVLSNEQANILNDTTFKIELTKQQIPIINATLVGKGIQIYRMQPLYKSLEDEFLEVTGGVHS
ncbi:ABC transporter ATP-binding protein [Bacillus sp. CGMCC 1.16541]|uniref:ABC transporter ATP-binding protein n=1 Tax=Bacillus sp. CGMCC 1.16541 TaxID=2185143 RepID=UPI001950A89B|nr:ABC transporter ATP-binding protein [Bacillus sp. CGMCC 1.16541]